MNLILVLVCGAVSIWAGQLFWVRQALPYSASGQYRSPQTGIMYDEKIVKVAFGLFLLFSTLTLLLIFSAYKLYRANPRHLRH